MSLQKRTTADIQSPFFRLPRELRDEIYKYALGSEPSIMTHGQSVVLVTRGTPDREDAATRTRSLPSWLQNSKTICSEALGVFGYTQTFAAIDFGVEQSLSRKRGYLEPRPKRNSLVFYANVIRNIAVRKVLWRTSTSTSEIDKKFLLALSRLSVDDINLTSVWISTGQPER
ncbi:hypothetical protein CC86DRAFT_400364 [Ophiobolus disseminans]|uniref:F-box domain-containing protein n=1 Tax=Ophiobolus disseminans TaxID=1469910 RepID=A0A6A7AKH5_9PLEO|nr:hypothetical protein CC86DRAFT_400364 [Ophiobolus disseminans]